MKKGLLFITVAALLVSSQGMLLASSDDSTGNIHVFYGSKNLDKDDWRPVEDHDEIGIKVDLRKKGWPVSLAIDYLSSESDTFKDFDPSLGQVSVSAKTSELGLGIRKIWEDIQDIHPFIGAGLAVIEAEVAASVSGQGSTSVSDSAIGPWFEAGAYFTLADHFNIGLNYRQSKGKVNFIDASGEAGGKHLGLLVGYHW